MSDLLPLPAAPTRPQIERLEALMLEAEGEAGVQVDTWHQFAPGLYARTILIRAGTLLTGAAHREGHLNIAHGDITVWTEDGMKRLTGYHVLPSRPGAKRVGLAHADTYWTTVHANPGEVRDVGELEHMLAEDPESLQHRRLAALARPANPESLS